VFPRLCERRQILSRVLAVRLVLGFESVEQIADAYAAHSWHSELRSAALFGSDGRDSCFQELFRCVIVGGIPAVLTFRRFADVLSVVVVAVQSQEPRR